MKLRLIPAQTGLHWVRQGVGTFLRQAPGFSGLVLLWCLCMALASWLPEALGLVPWLGSILSLALWPAFSLTTMVAAADIHQGRKLRLSLLWVAWRTRHCRRAMATLGALYCTAWVLAFAASMLVDDGRFVHFYLGLEDATGVAETATTADITATAQTAQAAPETMQTLFAQNPQALAALLLVGCSTALLGLPFWHAPALVFWHQVPPLQALFFSTVACVRNFPAFALYILVWMGLALLCLLTPLLLVAVLAPVLGNALPAAATALMFMLLLPLWCAFEASVVFSFQDCFSPPR